MHAPIDRKKLERFGRFVAEGKRRKAKKEQSQRGYYDDNGVRQGGLIAFVRYFWDVLEPDRKFVDGWPLQAMCEHLEAVTSGEITRLLINVPPGFMKEVNVDEPVLTKRGRIRLGDVVIGDEILTHKGRFRRVEKIADKGLQPTLLITTANGRQVKAEESHPFLTTRGWIEARFLRPGDIVAAVTPETDPFEKNDCLLEEEARLLGYLIGDGALTHSPSFTNADEEILCDFINCATILGFRAERREPSPSAKAKNAKATLVGLAGSLAWLDKHNIRGKSSYTKRVPESIFRSSEAVIANFIGAYWSCDGSIKVRHARKRGDLHLAICTTVSEGLARDLQHLLLRLGIHARIRRKAVNLESKRQPGGKYISWNVFSATHDNAVKFYGMPGLCSRKSKPLGVLTPQKFYQGPLFEDEVVSIDPIGQTECRCLTIEEDHSFTASDIAVHNSMLVDVFWPAWEWGPMKKTHYRYVAFSYSASLTERDNDKFRVLVTSEKYQRLYGPMKAKVKREVREFEEIDALGQVSIKNKTTIKVMNTRTGWKLASSIGGVATGERGDRIIVDDPHNVIEAESEIVRDFTVKWFRESISSRFNDLDTGALVIIMQRVHAGDVSGLVLGEEFDYCHLMIPWEFEPQRIVNEKTGEPYPNQIGWLDPRLELDDDGNVVFDDGELPNAGEPAWRDRFSDEAMARTQREIAEYGWAGQYQQRPAPRGGGLFQRDLVKDWSPDDGKWPRFDYVLASLDAAATEKEENCPSGFSVWGTFRPDNSENNGIMLIDAWRKRLKLHGILNPRQGTEIPQLGDDINRRRQRDMMWRNRCGRDWGLIEWIAFSCRYHNVDLLLIESEKTGIAVAQEMQRLYADEQWAVQLSPVRGDKFARALSVQPLFSQGKIWTPVKDWAEVLWEEATTFPRHQYRDLTDSMTQALRHIRMVGLAPTDEELKVAERERVMHGPRQKALYDV